MIRQKDGGRSALITRIKWIYTDFSFLISLNPRSIKLLTIAKEFHDLYNLTSFIP